jgi:hypothetical protein
MSGDDQQFVARVQRVDEEGRQRYGDQWGVLLDAISKQNPQGINNDVMAHVVAQPNAADILAAGGRDAMINLATAGDQHADRAYSQMREAERREYRLLKGRGPG